VPAKYFGEETLCSYTMFAEAELLDQTQKYVQSAHWEYHVYDVQYDIQDTQTLTDFLLIPEGLAISLSTGSMRHQMEGHCTISQVGQLKKVNLSFVILARFSSQSFLLGQQALLPVTLDWNDSNRC